MEGPFGEGRSSLTCCPPLDGAGLRDMFQCLGMHRNIGCKIEEIERGGRFQWAGPLCPTMC